MTAHDMQSDAAASRKLRVKIGLRYFVGASAALAVVVGLTGLAGQIWEIDYLRSPWPGLVGMKINTGIGFVLLGVALWIQKETLDSKRGRIAWHAARTFAFMVAFVGLLSLFEITFGWDFRIDQAIHPETVGEAFGSIRPGLMSPITAVNFLLLGLSLAFLDWATPRRRIWASQSLCFGAVVLSLFALMDFILAPHAFHTHIALQTVVTFCVLSLAVLCSRPEDGLILLLTSSSSRQGVLRIFLHRSGEDAWKRYWPARYGFGVPVVGVALVLSYVLRTYVGVTGNFLMFYPAVMLVTIVAGLGPGVFSTLLSAFCAAYFFMEPRHHFQVSSLADVIGLALFVIIGSCMSLLVESVEWTRKRVEERLRSSALYARSLLEASLDPLLTISREGKITDVNEATERVTGIAREGLIGTDFSNYFTEPEKARQGYGRAFADGTVHDYPLAILSNSGAVTDVVYNASVFKNEAGEVDGVFAAARDITERKREEQARQQSELKYRTLLESLPQMVFAKDRSLHYLSCNQNYADLLGIRPEEFSGKTDYDFFVREMADKYRADDQRVMDRGVTEEIVEEVTRGGKTMTVQTVKAPLLDADGKITGVLGIFWDITARREAEQKLRQQAALLDLAHDAVIVRGLDGRILFWNRGAEDLYGWTGDRALGKIAADLLQAEYPEPLEGIESSIQKSRAWEGELKHICSDGRKIIVASRWSLLRDERSNPTAILEINRDITERKQAEEELAARAQELARSNADLQQFAYVASHDLQEPLRMVASYTQLLAKRYRGKLDADADDFIGFAVDGAHRMQALVNDLLAYSRVETRGKEFSSTEADAALDNAVRNLKVAIEETHAIVSHDPLPTVPADATQLCQIFQNLIGNAVKFHGPERPRIHVSAKQQGGEWCFSVRDNGIGIDPRNSDRIFVIFQRLHAGREYPGTGIGLAITKKIVERHGGRIWVKSEPGQGSTFSFTIPDVKVAYDNYCRAGAGATD